jgi:hypothetical protein
LKFRAKVSSLGELRLGFEDDTLGVFGEEGEEKQASSVARLV